MWQTRALELNNQAYWNWDKACELLEYAVSHEFNTVIVGLTDLFNKRVSPKGYTPHNYNDYLSSQQRARCVYLNRLAKRCQTKGLRFYLQAKELSFPTDLLCAHQQISSSSGLLVAISNTDGLLPISRPNGELSEIHDDEMNDARSLSLYNRIYPQHNDRRNPFSLIGEVPLESQQHCE